MSDKEKLALLAMLESIEKINKITSSISSSQQFENEVVAFDACLMNFIVIGEMVIRLSDNFLNK